MRWATGVIDRPVVVEPGDHAALCRLGVVVREVRLVVVVHGEPHAVALLLRQLQRLERRLRIARLRAVQRVLDVLVDARHGALRGRESLARGKAQIAGRTSVVRQAHVVRTPVVEAVTLVLSVPRHHGRSSPKGVRIVFWQPRHLAPVSCEARDLRGSKGWAKGTWDGEGGIVRSASPIARRSQGGRREAASWARGGRERHLLVQRREHGVVCHRARAIAEAHEHSRPAAAHARDGKRRGQSCAVVGARRCSRGLDGDRSGARRCVDDRRAVRWCDE